MLRTLRLTPILLRSARPTDLKAFRDFVRDWFPEVRLVMPADLSEWLANTARPVPVLVDVRSKEEFATSHLKGAVHAASALDSSRLLDTSLVLYCCVGYRAAKLATRLRRRGFAKVHVLEGGIFQWANEGRPLYRGSQLVHGVHPHGRKWRPLLKPSADSI